MEVFPFLPLCRMKVLFAGLDVDLGEVFTWTYRSRITSACEKSNNIFRVRDGAVLHDDAHVGPDLPRNAKRQSFGWAYARDAGARFDAELSR
jgi:hypothetical protein